MGREHMLPPALATVHPTHGTPSTAIVCNAVFAVVVTLVVGAVGGYVHAYAYLGSLLTLAIIPVYVLTNAACIRFFATTARARRNTLRHVVLPVLGMLLSCSSPSTAWCGRCPRCSVQRVPLPRRARGRRERRSGVEPSGGADRRRSRGPAPCSRPRRSTTAPGAPAVPARLRRWTHSRHPVGRGVGRGRRRRRAPAERRPRGHGAPQPAVDRASTAAACRSGRLTRAWSAGSARSGQHLLQGSVREGVRLGHRPADHVAGVRVHAERERRVFTSRPAPRPCPRSRRRTSSSRS